MEFGFTDDFRPAAGPAPPAQLRRKWLGLTRKPMTYGAPEVQSVQLFQLTGHRPGTEKVERCPCSEFERRSHPVSPVGDRVIRMSELKFLVSLHRPEARFQSAFVEPSAKGAGGFRCSVTFSPTLARACFWQVPGNKANSGASCQSPLRSMGDG